MTSTSLPSQRIPRLRAHLLKRFDFTNRLVIVGALVLAVTWIGAIGQTAIAVDWPQINGPNRNGVADREVLLTEFPTGGLKQLWAHPVGQGNAGPVVVGDKVIVFHRPGKQNLVEALNAETGKLIWKQAIPAGTRSAGPDGDLGPKAIPLIHGGHVYVFGSAGNLCCLSLDEGKIVWKKNVLELYRSPSGYFGSGSSPIVIDDKLLLNVGGKDASVVAFDLKTGDELWEVI